GLPGIGDADERHARAPLKVQTEPGDRWLGDQNPDSTLGEVEQHPLLIVGRVSATDLDGSRNESYELVGFRIQIAPDEPLLIRLRVHRLGAHRRALSDARLARR